MKAPDTVALRSLAPALVGVSGGRDSVALLHLLVNAGARELVAVHVDHGLRAESAEDAKFVTEFAVGLGVACVLAREDVRARAKRTRRSLETAARDARHACFARIAEERGLTRLLLAHHADDQVETFLFNLLRGAGTRGLGGMRLIAKHRIGAVELEVHRPLLAIWRDEIDEYLARHQLAFRDDASNTDRRHSRNRIRHELTPLLSSVMGRDVRKAIWRSATICADEDAFLGALLTSEDKAPELSVAGTRELPLAVQRRVLHAWLGANGVRDLSFDDVESVRSLIDQPRAKVNLAGGRHARRRCGRLFLE